MKPAQASSGSGTTHPSDLDPDESGLDELSEPVPARKQSSLEDAHLEAAEQAQDPERSNNVGPRPKDDEKSGPDHQILSPFATRLYVLSYLVFFSFLGTLARLGLQALTFYPGAPTITGVLWPNFAGSFIIGFLAEDKRVFAAEWGRKNVIPATSIEKGHDQENAKRAHTATKKTIPLYIGLSVGFCGCFTSFSTFIRDAMLALSNDLPSPTTPSLNPRHAGDSFLALTAVLLLTISLSLSGLILGAHLALALHPFTPALPFTLTRHALDPAIALLAWPAWLGCILLCIFPPDRPGGSAAGSRTNWKQETWRSQALFALVFAPLGCLGRFYMSKALNQRIAKFPLGTFVANVAGTVILGMAWDLQRVPVGGMVGCQVLQGIEDGFCGCLTTVSTWVLELKGLRRKYTYIYGTLSVAVSLAFLVIIMGSMRWTRGFAEKLCIS
ncbi:MAG: hypothetical protein M1814_004792 [Vezdaea aestivalis]|nr:MAG: hypothetical protein M1814_004792 [Vezdaea aestivalis]